MLPALLEGAIDKINNTKNLFELDEIRVQFLGKSGVISEEMKKLSSLNPEDKKKLGQELNQTKNILTEKLQERKKIFSDQILQEKLMKEKLDVTLPARKQNHGKIHPISQAKIELVEIFASLGFEIKDGPNIESDWYNFTALNIDENHPARQMHDTFYMPSSDDENYLLRTHTSPVQIRAMQAGKPPFKLIAPGRTYRSDYDQTHTPMFHQIEILAVDEKLTMSELKFVIHEFIYAFFEGLEPEVRFRPSFFPFTTPSAEVDIRFTGGKWLEVLGCGMVHPNVLKNAGIDPTKYQGFAAGLGIERMAMLKYGIDDLRQFFESDVRWLDHYGFSPFDVPSVTGGLTR